MNKGSQALVDLWLRRPDFPLLTMVQRATLQRPTRLPGNLRLIDGYLDDAELGLLQNRHLFHLCPSETEGFGHHLVEGMSVGAIVLATDAPPMNELVTPERGVLAAANRSGTQRLATTWFVDPAALEAAVERMLALDGAARATRCECACVVGRQRPRVSRADCGSRGGAGPVGAAQPRGAYDRACSAPVGAAQLRPSRCKLAALFGITRLRSRLQRSYSQVAYQYG